MPQKTLYESLKHFWDFTVICIFLNLIARSRVCFCNWLKALPLIVSICQSIVWMRSPITDLARGQLDFSWFNWIYDMSQIQTSSQCVAVTASLLHIKNSFQNVLWLRAWQIVKKKGEGMKSNKWLHFWGESSWKMARNSTVRTGEGRKCFCYFV